MYRITADKHKNRLYVVLDGYFNVDEMIACVDETISATSRLQQGFDVITDISRFKPGKPEVSNEIERAQAHFVAAGVNRGVRVVGGRTLTGMQFKRTGSAAGYLTTIVATLEEAEAVLA